MSRKSNRLFKYTVTGTISYPFTLNVLAPSEDEAEREAERADADDPNMVLGVPMMDLENIEDGWDGDYDPRYEPEGGSPLDAPDRW